jgi:hypothetical protein
MSISEHFRYRNDVFQSDIFVFYIGITDVDVGCRISDIADIDIDVNAHLWYYDFNNIPDCIVDSNNMFCFV